MKRERSRPPGEGRLIQLVYYAYVAASAVARWLPERFVYGLADRIGSFGARFSKQRVQVAKNLARITGEPSDSARVRGLVVEAYQSYARYWLETFRLVRERKEFFLERVHSPTQENLFGLVRQGQGTIVAVGHLGNWDAAGAWVGASGFSLVTVAEVLKPRRMFEFFADHRAALGMTIHGAEKGVTKKLADAIRAGAVVAILADRDLKGTGPVVDFFGEPTHMPAGAAAIALETGCPICVAGVFSIVREDGKRGWEIIIDPPLEVPQKRKEEAIAELTQKIATELERFVATRPEEWHVFQPFWIADREGAVRK